MRSTAGVWEPSTISDPAWCSLSFSTRAPSDKWSWTSRVSLGAWVSGSPTLVSSSSMCYVSGKRHRQQRGGPGPDIFLSRAFHYFIIHSSSSFSTSLHCDVTKLRHHCPLPKPLVSLLLSYRWQSERSSENPNHSILCFCTTPSNGFL